MPIPLVGRFVPSQSSRVGRSWMRPAAGAAEWWDRYQHIMSSDEPFLDEYAGHLARLNALVAESGAALEGNLFYHHRAPARGDVPDPTRRHKRVLYAAYALGGTDLLEIGFNAGHSALLGLVANPRLRYLGIDIGAHPYVRPCFEYLRAAFPGRVELRVGGSGDVLRDLLRTRGRRWDLFHVDGGHLFDAAYSDLVLTTTLAPRGGTVLLDDVKAKSVRAACNLLLFEGRVALQPLLPDLESDEQALLRVC